MEKQLFSNEKHTICSVFFQPLKTQRDYSPNGRNGFLWTFEMPAVKSRDAFEVLPIYTHWQEQRNGREQQWQTPVFAEDLADDLVTTWRDNRQFLEQGRPGIMKIAGDTPTAEELATMHQWQDAWCEAHYIEAEDLNAKGAKAGITKLHRACAIHIGREAAEWVHNVASASLMPCPLCTARIDSTSIVCRECGNIVDFDRYLNHQQRMAEYEAKVAEMREKRGLSTAPQGKLVVPPLPQIPKLAAK